MPFDRSIVNAQIRSIGDHVGETFTWAPAGGGATVTFQAVARDASGNAIELGLSRPLTHVTLTVAKTEFSARPKKSETFTGPNGKKYLVVESNEVSGYPVFTFLCQVT